MRITFRLVISLLIVVTFVAGLFTYFQVEREKERLAEDVERRSWLVAEGLRESIEPLMPDASSKLSKITEKISKNERITGIAIYDTTGTVISVTKDLSLKLPSNIPFVQHALKSDKSSGKFENIGPNYFYLYAAPLLKEGERIGTIVIFNEASYIKRHLSKIWRDNFFRLLIQALLIVITTLIIVRWSITGPIEKMAEWIKELRKGEPDAAFKLPKEDLFAPLSKEISSMAKSLAAARARAEEEAKLRRKGEDIWTAEKLKEHVKAKLKDKPLYVVSNREPYMHIRKGRQIECIVPASGLITALEPVLRASGGMWVASGSGDADRETTNSKDIIRVPPDDPRYNLKRVWLSKEEETGFYYGFSNEGLWPLCHIAHTRPVFRGEDWEHYQKVNYKFAEALIKEMDEEPFVFIQDYHFALLPRIIKNKRPDAKVALFWHIPWPNPEAFGICPWRRELLHGMLGADLIGFHTQFYCNNFLDTVNITLECRIDWEQFTAIRQNHTTHTRPFPIGIDYTPFSESNQTDTIDKETLIKNLGIQAELIGVGVDRLDYTKGIVERFRAIERFLEKYPEYRGKFTFIELGAPSRTLIQRYHDLMAEIDAEVDRLNWKFQQRNWKPIIFLKKHHSHEEIRPYYRNADLCMVTSLHDGMNLVAMEYVAASADGNGALILSRFTGAASMLKDAIQVNPYDIEQMADAIYKVLTMDSDEKIARTRRMKAAIAENNIYKWAADIINYLTQIRQK